MAIFLLNTPLYPFIGPTSYTNWSNFVLILLSNSCMMKKYSGAVFL